VFRKDLGKLVERLLAASGVSDDKRFFSALQATADALPKAKPAEIQAALEKLIPVLDRISFGPGRGLARLAGIMMDEAGVSAAALQILVRRAVEAMEQALRFEQLYTAAYEEPPAPDDEEAIPATLQRFTGDAARHGLTGPQAAALVEAWFCVNEWVQPVLYLSQRKDVRAVLPDRERLTGAVAAVREYVETAHWLDGLLRVLDDEPLIVLHRATGAGFRVRISGVGDNFQLHTLLAAALLGSHLPGERPNRAEIAAVTDGDPQPSGGIRGSFNLVDAHGEWIWNEGRPADIPAVDGSRVAVIDPAPYPRTWNAGRAYPLMRPELTVESVLSADEAARWTSKVKPDRRG
jgi:hypothetical protein